MDIDTLQESLKSVDNPALMEIPVVVIDVDTIGTLQTAFTHISVSNGSFHSIISCRTVV